MSYGMPRASSEVGTFGSRRRTCCPTSVSSHQSIANRAAAAADYGTIYGSSAALADNWMRKHEPYDAGALHTPTGTITYLNDRSPVTYLSAAGDSRRSGIARDSRPQRSDLQAPAEDWAHVELFRKQRARTEEAAALEARRMKRMGCRDIAPHVSPRSAVSMATQQHALGGFASAQLAPGGRVVEGQQQATRTDFSRPLTDLLPYTDASPINQAATAAGRKLEPNMLGEGAGLVVVDRPGGWKTAKTAFTGMAAFLASQKEGGAMKLPDSPSRARASRRSIASPWGTGAHEPLAYDPNAKMPYKPLSSTDITEHYKVKPPSLDTNIYGAGFAKASGELAREGINIHAQPELESKPHDMNYKPPPPNVKEIVPYSKAPVGYSKEEFSKVARPFRFTDVTAGGAAIDGGGGLLNLTAARRVEGRTPGDDAKAAPKDAYRLSSTDLTDPALERGARLMRRTMPPNPHQERWTARITDVTECFHNCSSSSSCGRRRRWDPEGAERGAMFRAAQEAAAASEAQAAAAAEDQGLSDEQLEWYRQLLADKIHEKSTSLQKVFRELDGDNSGLLDVDEMGQAMARFNLEIPRAHLAQFVAYMCDQDGDGKVDYQEFSEALRRHDSQDRRRAAASKGRSRRAAVEGVESLATLGGGRDFRSADADNSGTLDFEEFKSLMRRTEPNGNYSDAELRRRFALFDADMSGRIDKAEFQKGKVRFADDKTNLYAKDYSIAPEKRIAGDETFGAASGGVTDASVMEKTSRQKFDEDCLALFRAIDRGGSVDGHGKSIGNQSISKMELFRAVRDDPTVRDLLGLKAPVASAEGHKEMSRIFAEMDRDGNDDCSYPEFRVLYAKIVGEPKDEDEGAHSGKHAGHWAEGAKRDFDKARGWRKHGLMVADDDADAAAGRAKADAAAESIDEQYAALARACEARDRGRTGELPLAQVRAAAAAVGVTLPDEAVIKMLRPLAQKPRDPLTSDRNRSGEHWDSPIFDVVDHREFVQALRWHAMQGLAEPAHREILNAERDLELLPHARRHELIHRVHHANEAGARGAIAPDDGLGNHWARMSDVRDASLGGGKVYPVPNSSSWHAGRHLPGDKASPQRGHASTGHLQRQASSGAAGGFAATRGRHVSEPSLQLG